MSHGLVRHHFGTRDALIHEAVLDLAERSLQSTRLESGTGRLEDLGAGTSRMVTDAQNLPGVDYELVLEARRRPSSRRPSTRCTTATSTRRAVSPPASGSRTTSRSCASCSRPWTVSSSSCSSSGASRRRTLRSPASTSCSRIGCRGGRDSVRPDAGPALRRRDLPDDIGVWVLAGHGMVNYDTLYTLVWGREIAAGRTRTSTSRSRRRRTRSPTSARCCSRR